MAHVVTFPSSQGDDLVFDPEPQADPIGPGDEIVFDPEPASLDEGAAPGGQADVEQAEPAASVATLVSPALVEVLPLDFPLPVLARFIPNPAIRTAVQEATARALAIDVTGPEAVKAADQALGDIRSAIKAVDAHFEEPASIAHDLHRHITGLRGRWKADGEAALVTVGQRVSAEVDRLEALAREEARRHQEEADRQAREQAAHEAAEAAAAGAPEPVVEELQQMAQAATAAPVALGASVSSSLLANSARSAQWKARIVGTPGTDEPNPSIDALTPAQRAKILELVKAIAEGRAPLLAIDLNWKWLNARAKADKTAMGVPGIEAFKVSGLKGKGGR